MVDKLLDEDDIIDLTDLLEEGDSKKKGKGKKDGGAPLNTLSNEPDSFDLGKEISMEYDVSVEEIDHTGESLDIDVSLSSSEEVALKQDGKGEGDEEVPGALEAAEAELILEPEEKSVPDGAELTRDEQDVLSLEVKEEELLPEIREQEEPAAAVEEGVVSAEEAGISSPVAPLKGKSGKKKATAPEPLELMEEEEITAPEEPLSTTGDTGELQARITEDALLQLKQDLPGILEGVVRPLMTELIREIISTTRDQLPGIVEKVIREEIDKLKKLD
ncbi:hypothetical protein EG833_01930 [archaeon]|nr:hypothetical protein [archaeon]